MLSNIEWGSVADWFTGLITALGIYLAIRESKLRIQIKHRVINEKLMIEIHNKSSFEIEINNIYAYYYIKRFREGPIAIYNRWALEEVSNIILQPHETKKINVSINLHNYKKKYAYLKYGCEYQGGLTREVKVRRRIKVQDYKDE